MIYSHPLEHVEKYSARFFTRPLLPEGSSLQVEILSVCLSVRHHFIISNLGPSNHPRIMSEPTYYTPLERGWHQRWQGQWQRHTQRQIPRQRQRQIPRQIWTNYSDARCLVTAPTGTRSHGLGKRRHPRPLLLLLSTRRWLDLIAFWLLMQIYHKV